MAKKAKAANLAVRLHPLVPGPVATDLIAVSPDDVPASVARLSRRSGRRDHRAEEVMWASINS